jgi:hypothetical protein
MVAMRTAIADLSASKKSTGYQLDINKKILTLVAAWTSNPVGVLGLEVSNDSTNGTDGSWVGYTGVTMPKQPAGTADSMGVELIDFGWAWYRWSWTFTSGGGILSDAPNQK